MTYIFTPPAAAYELKFEFWELNSYINRGRGNDSRKVGTTVTLIKGSDDIEVWLYQTKIGSVARDGEVRISEAINAHGSQATTWWVQKMLADNGHNAFVARERGRYSVAGRTFALEAAK